MGRGRETGQEALSHAALHWSGASGHVHQDHQDHQDCCERWAVSHCVWWLIIIYQISASPAREQRSAAHSRKRPGSQQGEVEGTSSKRLRQSGEVAVAILSVFITDATDRQCVHNC